MQGGAGGDELYLHIRVVLGIILGLSITTLLKGFASVVEHPRRYGWSWMHMSWAAWALISVVTFWWWEFRLAEAPAWTFGAYLFVVAYGSLYFLLSTLLFPSDVREFAGYEDYLIQRRAWFFGLIALITLMDLVDTSLKGAGRWRALGPAYPVRTVAMLAIAGLGIAWKGRRAQTALAVVALVFGVVYFGLEYFTLSAD